jgi:hypothetical protein
MATFSNTQKSGQDYPIYAGNPFGPLLFLTYPEQFTVTGISWSHSSRASAATFTNTSRNVQYLWSALTYPWQEPAPWLINGTGLKWTPLTKN